MERAVPPEAGAVGAVFHTAGDAVGEAAAGADAARTHAVGLLHKGGQTGRAPAGAAGAAAQLQAVGGLLGAQAGVTPDDGGQKGISEGEGGGDLRQNFLLK